jgi:hypothetical protein
MSGRDIPALFSAPMVRANLRDVDPKTMTRRPLYVLRKFRNSLAIDGRYETPAALPPVGHDWSLSNWSKAAPGDRIWQRETWAPQADCESSAKRWTIDWPIQHGPKPIVHFSADDNPRAWVTKWRPSIHMPRWVCRFEALIKAVRIERLQDISEADAIAEGIEQRANAGQDSARWRVYGTVDTYTSDPVSSYQSLWESINGAGSWAENPWIVVITYERIKEA